MLAFVPVFPRTSLTPAVCSAIQLPENNYPIWESVGEEIVNTGKLSKLQLEGVRYACKKHLEILSSGQRAGFFIGDGAGVGKGRQIAGMSRSACAQFCSVVPQRPCKLRQLAGIILDNFCRGRTRHVWLSSSTDLHADATRDLRDLGMQIPVINNCSALDGATKVGGLSQDFKEGVLFLTYSTLVSAGRGGRTRFQQVLDWVGGDTFDGCIVFDECHRCARCLTLALECLASASGIVTQSASHRDRLEFLAQPRRRARQTPSWQTDL